MFIDEIDLFHGIDPEVMQQMGQISSEETYVKDTVLFEKGEDARHLYILEDGMVNLIIKNGSVMIYSLTVPGEVFGWSSMAENGHYTSSGVCATDVSVVKLEREKLNQIFDRYPDVGLKIVRRLVNVFSKRLSNAYSELLSIRSGAPPLSFGKDEGCSIR